MTVGVPFCKPIGFKLATVKGGSKYISRFLEGVPLAAGARLTNFKGSSTGVEGSNIFFTELKNQKSNKKDKLQ